MVFAFHNLYLVMVLTLQLVNSLFVLSNQVIQLLPVVLLQVLNPFGVVLVLLLDFVVALGLNRLDLLHGQLLSVFDVFLQSAFLLLEGCYVIIQGPYFLFESNDFFL